MKSIFSAGGIVVKDEGGPKVLVAQHSGHKGWDFPKGHVEAGESPEQAAVREVDEETGVKAEVVEKVGDSEYFYIHDGEKIFKTVTYFLMKYVGEGEATTAWETSDMVWLAPEEVSEKLTFKGSKEVWQKAKERVKGL